MGLGIGDYNLDGKLDILKTHFADDTAVLYRNDGKGNFEDVTNSVGLGVETRSLAGAPACSIWITMAIPIFSGSPAACIRKLKRFCRTIPSRVRAFFSAISATKI